MNTFIRSAMDNIVIPEPVNNEISIEFTSTLGNNPFVRSNSGSRDYMYGGQLTQRVVTDVADEKRIQTGAEDEFGKYTFNVSMPKNGKIIALIERYPRSMGYSGINFNPETLVVFEEEDTKVIDYFIIPQFLSFHQYFGYRLKHSDQIHRLVKGAYIPEGTIFADTPSKLDNGTYCQGTECNIALGTLPATAEDGFVISDTFAKRLGFKIFERARISTGNTSYPLDIYRDPNNPDIYKPFPDIGEYVRSDGLLMVLRDYNYDLAPVEMSRIDLIDVNNGFDKPEYVRPGKGRVIDIIIHHERSLSAPGLPTKMDENMDKYVKAGNDYHNRIKQLHSDLKQQRKSKGGDTRVPYSPALHALIVQAMANTEAGNEKASDKLNRLYRKSPMDNYTIEFVIEYEIQPNIGFKVAGSSGDKGIFCKIEKSENMPVDIDGNRADIWGDSIATVNRMIAGRSQEHYLSGSCRDSARRIATAMNVHESMSIEDIRNSIYNHSEFDICWEYAIGFYRLITPLVAEDILAMDLTHDEKVDHIAYVIKNWFYLSVPQDNPVDYTEVFKEIIKHYPCTRGPVTFVDDSGKKQTSKDPIIVAPYYIMLLEKIADDGSSVSSGKLSIHGILSPATKTEKTSTPHSSSATRTTGETENRIMASYVGLEGAAEHMDRNNSPIAHRHVTMSIISAERPLDIDRAVDRNIVPLGGSRPLQMTKHVIGCGGVEIVWEPEE